MSDVVGIVAEIASGFVPGSGLIDAGIAISQGRYADAAIAAVSEFPVFKVAGAVAGGAYIAYRAVRQIRRLSRATTNVPNPGGRLGSPGTRQQNYDIATEMERRGFRITGGGGRLPEEYLPGPGGGRRGSNWVDITAEKNGRTVRVNTVDTLVDGVTPNSRERAAADLIRGKTPGDHLLTIPKR